MCLSGFCLRKPNLIVAGYAFLTQLRFVLLTNNTNLICHPCDLSYETLCEGGRQGISRIRLFVFLRIKIIRHDRAKNPFVPPPAGSRLK